MDKECKDSKYLREPYLQLSKAKFKYGIFTEPDIIKVIRDPPFEGKFRQMNWQHENRLFR